MKARFHIAQMVGAVSTLLLKHALHRPGANFPGKVGLYIDPQLIGDLRARIRTGTIVVVGTNGKTTVTNMLADAFTLAGATVACNRTGANLDSGVATTLLQTKEADWGIFESDELWLARIAPQLKPDYVVLLNLFRDQLDRVGEIDHIQESIVSALTSSRETTLIYNCDDPLCQAIADQVDNKLVAFGIDEDLGLPQNTVADSGMCWRCGTPVEYEWRQYGQLGNFRCPNCSTARISPTYAACEVRMTSGQTSFSIRTADKKLQVNTKLPGAYVIYNLLAVYTAADCCSIPSPAIGEAVSAFDPKNGRLQTYEIAGHRILLNLAKNPTGFNQNLRIALGDEGPKAIAFFINDKEADGHDVSWLWDVDFQELADDGNIVAFAGGLRRDDMRVRLKYAGIDAQLVDGAAEFLNKALASLPDASLYLIANYTALPDVKAELDRMAQSQQIPLMHADPQTHAPKTMQRDNQSIGQTGAKHSGEKLVIAHMYPELLNLYGDGGNVIVLEKRVRLRGIDVEVVRVDTEQPIDFADVDIVFIGGGPDHQQQLASQYLLAQTQELNRYVEDDGVLLAICGGFQIIGREWLLGDETVPGLGLIGATTRRAQGGSHNRLVGNIVLNSPLAQTPVVGYENHAGRTFLDDGFAPFGTVVGRRGKGNNDTDAADGVLYRNVIGTYLHGPLLSKNPEVADELIRRALVRRAVKRGQEPPALPRLDDEAELAANEFIQSER